MHSIVTLFLILLWTLISHFIAFVIFAALHLPTFLVWTRNISGLHLLFPVVWCTHIRQQHQVPTPIFLRQSQIHWLRVVMKTTVWWQHSIFMQKSEPQYNCGFNEPQYNCGYRSKNQSFHNVKKIGKFQSYPNGIWNPSFSGIILRELLSRSYL